ncbi:MAG: beta-ketoacyl synthase chain length factor [Verrucomicrobia bacterium]|nr:beta-ketoacyl synthase chain length factor [Verrucomicrobiota bacterium]
MPTRFPVITGLGIVSAAGSGVDETWRAIAAGTDGLRPLSLFSSPRYGPVPTGEVRRDLRELGAPLRGSRSDRLAWLAARDAIGAAKLDSQNVGERGGVLLGGSVGGSFGSERFLTTLIKDGKMRPRPTRFHECVSAVEIIADDFGLFGPSLAISTACSSGALAIAAAAELIMAGEADVMLAGGADSLSRMTWGGFHSLLLVDTAGCRPFDAGRAGMSLGEGAAVLVLEAEETARRRGAKILARLTGWGASCDAHHATAPHPEGAGALAAMQSALRRAGLEPAAIGYVNAHGTGTRDNDLAESKALKQLFGDRVPPFSSTKRYFGHSLAASGAIEAVVCIEALRRQLLPPNPGFGKMDPAIGLAPVTELRSEKLTHVMSNSFGFGGNNAALIFSTPDTTPLTRAAQPGPVAVSGIGVVGPGLIRVREIEPPLPAGQVTVHDCGALADAALLSPNQRRRLCRLIQMALIAARRSHTADAAQRLVVAMGTGLGCVEEGAVFLDNLISKDEREPMPSRFPGSVHNAAAGQIAIDLGAHGLNSAPTAGEISFEAALWQGMNQLAAGEADAALVGAVDELNKFPLAIGKRWGLWNERTIPGEGAMVASLVRAEKNSKPLARVTAVRLGRYRKPFDADREADWIASSVDLKTVDVFLSGAKGWPALDEKYAAVAAALSARAGRTLEYQTYKQLCGEFYSASAFGFSVAVELVRQRGRGVLLYTLSLRGAKAVCCVQP